MSNSESTNDATDAESKYERLLGFVESTESLLIVCHNNPDPDAIGSAVGIEHISEFAAVPQTEITYGGQISHQQNRAMINTLDIELTPFEDISLDAFERIAFVDHSVPGRNNPVPSDTPPDIILDHHSGDEPAAEFVDHRPDVGATATLVTEYIRELPTELTDRLATILLFAIHRETLGFSRGTTPAEHAIAAYLHPPADHGTIQTLVGSVFTPETLSGIGKAITNREVRGSCLVSTVGRTTERDILPQAADYMMKLAGVSTTVVFGIIEDTIHISARTDNSQLDIGALMSDAFDEIGSAGGHGNMAGAQVPLGLFGSGDSNSDAIKEITNKAVRTRVFEALDEWTYE